jgi:hypothetical protein
VIAQKLSAIHGYEPAIETEEAFTEPAADRQLGDDTDPHLLLPGVRVGTRVDPLDTLRSS